MYIHDTPAWETMALPEPPAGSLLELEASGAVQSVIAHEEGFNSRTRLSLIIGFIPLAIGIALGASSAFYYFAGGLDLSDLLVPRRRRPWLLGISVFFAALGYITARPSLQASYCKLVLKISNGFLTIDYHGPFSNQSTTVSLANVLRTTVTKSENSASLSMQLPNFNEMPRLGSYECSVVSDRNVKDVVWIQEWLEKNIEVAKIASRL